MLKAENLFKIPSTLAPSDGVFACIPTGTTVYNPEGNLIEYGTSDYKTYSNWIYAVTSNDSNDSNDSSTNVLISMVAYSGAGTARSDKFSYLILHLPKNYQERIDFTKYEDFITYCNGQTVTVTKGITPNTIIGGDNVILKINTIESDNTTPRVTLSFNEEGFDISYVNPYLIIERIDTGEIWNLHQGEGTSMKTEYMYYTEEKANLFTNRDIGKTIYLKIYWGISN